MTRYNLCEAPPIHNGNDAPALEMNIHRAEIADALRRHPQFYNRPDVLKLLLDVQWQIERGDEAAEEEKHVREEYLKDFVHNVEALLACVEDKRGSELKAELPEAIEDVKRNLEELERADF